MPNNAAKNQRTKKRSYFVLVLFFDRKKGCAFRIEMCITTGGPAVSWLVCCTIFEIGAAARVRVRISPPDRWCCRDREQACASRERSFMRDCHDASFYLQNEHSSVCHAALRLAHEPTGEAKGRISLTGRARRRPIRPSASRQSIHVRTSRLFRDSAIVQSVLCGLFYVQCTPTGVSARVDRRSWVFSTGSTSTMVRDGQ